MPITQFLTDQAAFSPDDHPRYVATCSSEKLAVNQTRRNVGAPTPPCGRTRHVPTGR